MLTAEKLTELLEKSPEVVVYNTINGIGGFIFYMEHDMADDRIPKEDWPAINAVIAVAREEIKKLVESLTRFGVTTPLNANGRATAEYWQWFRWWDAYAKSLSNAEYDLLQTEITNGADLSKWRPQGDWKETKK